MFVDEVKVKLKAGDGGNGCAGFRREKYLPHGGPDGGDGGNGGNVILRGDENVGDLRQYYFKPHAEAESGEKGKGRVKTGRSGSDCVLKIPLGTVVTNLETGEVIAEITGHEEEFVLLKGGSGGWGNTHFKSSINQAPTQFKEGLPGERGEFAFVLKTIADIGLVGFPNAGKSTLTNLITSARPKTAAYPFTTLQPNVGVVLYPELYDRITLADIPGLIKGAHENKGLGHRFLRHIERCKALLLIIDMQGTDGRNPLDDYKDLLFELDAYSPDLLKKDIYVAANKMDEPDAPEKFSEFIKEFPGVSVYPISCLSEDGVSELKKTLYNAVKKVD
ncbi:MAG: GTPase ObgE [Opitutales bacterium]|nr:GTPase ObgE [Opitutales bacterium]